MVTVAEHDPVVLALQPPADSAMVAHPVSCRAGHVGDVHVAAFDRTGEVPATGGTDGRVVLFELGPELSEQSW